MMLDAYVRNSMYSSLKYSYPWIIHKLGNEYYVMWFLWRTLDRPDTYYKTFQEAENACKKAWLSLAML